MRSSLKACSQNKEIAACRCVGRVLQALPGPPLCTPSTQATMYMCPQLLREAVRGHEHEAEVLAVADIWALAVILYFLLFGCWPFSQDQIRQWPVTPAAEWRDDAAVSYELAPGAFWSLLRAARCDPSTSVGVLAQKAAHA